jgi:hypothetical protein
VIKIVQEKETDGKCIVSAQTSASQMQQVSWFVHI